MAKELLRLAVRCDEHAPRAVRAAMSRLTDLGWVLGDAMLVASELVTNAVRHSLCAEEELLSVNVSKDGRLKIAVLDPGASGQSAEIAHRQMGLGGLGLKVVEQLAQAWGTDRRGDGYEVWAELELPAA